MKKIVTTEKALANAFTEWERRYQADPDGFESSGTPEIDGPEKAAYLIEIINEQETEKSTGDSGG